LELELSADVAWSALAAHVGKVDQPELSVLAGLDRQAARERARRKNRGARRPEVGIAVFELLEIHGCVTVRRTPGDVRAVGGKGEHAIAPIAASGAGVELAVAGCEVDAIGHVVKGDAVSRPDPGSAGGAIRGARRAHEMH
jgi:hypothetical protein